MPVDIASGTTSLEFYDLEIGGRVPLRWSAYYASHLVDAVHTPLGRGWFGVAYCTLQQVEDGYEYVTERGGRVRFDDANGNVERGGIVRNLGQYLELFREGDDHIVRSWSIETGAVTCQRFNDHSNATGEAWRLAAVENNSGDGNDFIWRQLEGGWRLSAIRQRLEQRELRIAYDNRGWIATVTATSDASIVHPMLTYEHDLAGHLVSMTNSEGFSDRFEFDPSGRVTREILKDGGVFHYRYDAQGRCVHHSGLGHYAERRLRYIPSIGVTEVTDSRGETTTHTHLPSGQRIVEMDPIGGQRVSQYDVHGRLLRKTDATGSTTSFEYDSMGNLARVVDAAGGIWASRFDDSHQVVERVDANGESWRRQYRPDCRLVQATDPLGATWRYAYDDAGCAVKVVNPTGAERILAYDDYGQIARSTDWGGNTETYHHDDLGRLKQRTGPQGTIRYEYDRLGRAICVRFSDGTSISAVYDHASNLIKYVDGLGNATRWRYGPCGRLLERVDPMGGRLSYAWGTERGELLSITDESGSKCCFERDTLGRIVAETGFDGVRRSWALDAEGRVVEHVNGNGERVSVSWDALGRMVQQQLPEGESSTFVYDPLGRLVAASNQDSTISLQRDPWGRVVRETQNEHWINRVYDGCGSLIEVQSSAGPVVHMRVDPSFRVSELAIEGRRLTFERDAQGLETERRIDSRVLISQQHNESGQLVEQKIASRGLSVPWRRFGYDAAGRLTSTEDASNGITHYGYDAADRLTNVSSNKGRSETFAYDASHNRTAVELAGQALRQPEYQGNRLVRDGATQYEHDAEGRVIRKIEHIAEATHTTNYQWDALGRLKEVVLPDGTPWTYRYDPLARRFSKQAQGEEPHTYVWDGGKIMHELGGRSRQRMWLWDQDSHAPVASWQDQTLYNVVTDHLGTPRELLDPTGDVVWELDLDAWGGQRSLRRGARGPDCDIRFQGQWLDQESGLHYNWHRHYCPTLGRYMSPDPIGLLGGTNPYRYCVNPLNWVDPLGLCDNPPKSVREKIDKLRSGQDVHVKSIEEARHLLEHMPELRPHTQEGKMPVHPSEAGHSNPFWRQPDGTYRGDLINVNDPGGPVHPGVGNLDHANNPHYNLRFPDGTKSAIIIDP